ncbi:MAG: VWA domain-containing protein, partial [Pseudomonadota bacterium]
MSALFGDIEFAWPWMALCLFVPLLFRWLLPAAETSTGSALKVPDLAPFGTLLNAETEHRNFSGWFFLGLFAWGFLVLAAMRPQQLGEQTSAPVTGRNLMLAVDLSGSMDVPDFQIAGRKVNRLVATKAVASEFLDRREGDRIGLILFGQQAYLQAPLTFDRETVKTLLLESSIGLAGEKTAIGDAIGLAAKRIRDTQQQGSEQVLILLTDGANTEGELDPIKAAELASSIGLKIYTIGIGADRLEIASVVGGRTQLVNPSTDLDEKTLKAIASMTGGQYFRATDT